MDLHDLALDALLCGALVESPRHVTLHAEHRLHEGQQTARVIRLHHQRVGRRTRVRVAGREERDEGGGLLWPVARIGGEIQ